MRRPRLAYRAMPIVVLAASQVGHLLASVLRRGPGAPGLGGAGAHAYVPTLVTVLLGAAGGVVLAALLVMAAARVVTAGRESRGGSERGPLLDLAAVLFALQLGIFLVQEVAEAVASGGALPTAGDLLLWGSLGQLPVALVAALVLAWLSRQVEAAIVDLEAAAGRPLAPRPILAPLHAWTSPPAPPRAGAVAGAAAQRAPPDLLLQPIDR
jgi:hypothetical protein